MESSVLSNLPLMFIAAGLTLLAASMLLNWRARQHRQRMKHLLALASRNDIEPLQLPAIAWPTLAESGWQHLLWQGDWFGQPIHGELGHLPRRTQPLNVTLSVTLDGGEDARLTLHLQHGTPGGETRMFAEHLARVFFLLLETRLRARTEALSAALAERASLSLYLQHDMRNLAQWVSWMSADFAACASPEALLAAARRLRDNAPLAQERAERLIAALGQRPGGEQATALDLRQAVAQAAQLAGFTPLIDGQARACIAPSLLARALDNLFANLAAVWRGQATQQPPLQLTTQNAADGSRYCALAFHCPWPAGQTTLAAEKLFEPFASGRPGGLGLGLYQARKSLREAGGDLHAQPGSGGIDFLLHLPADSTPCPSEPPP